MLHNFPNEAELCSRHECTMPLISALSDMTLTGLLVLPHWDMEPLRLRLLLCVRIRLTNAVTLL